MAVRGTVDEVMALSGKRDPVLAELWLGAASALVDARLANQLDAATLARIEEHLAAHFVELGAGKQVTAERMPDWARSYATGPAGQASLASTRNGQIAQLLDTTGTLSEMTKPRPAFAVL